MTFNIPNGWKYAGNDYNGHANSFDNKISADNEAAILHRIYPKQDFTTIQHLDRWIVITEKDPLYDTFRKKSKKTKKCKCKK